MNEGKHININFVNWEDHVNKGIVLLDFWAEWCTACVAQDEIYREIAAKYAGDITVGKIHVGDNRFLAEKFGVRNIPFIILMNDGKEVARMNGIENKYALESIIEREIDKNNT
jgi:thioredoxin 1